MTKSSPWLPSASADTCYLSPWGPEACHSIPAPPPSIHTHPPLIWLLSESPASGPLHLLCPPPALWDTSAAAHAELSGPLHVAQPLGIAGAQFIVSLAGSHTPPASAPSSHGFSSVSISNLPLPSFTRTSVTGLGATLVRDGLIWMETFNSLPLQRPEVAGWQHASTSRPASPAPGCPSVRRTSLRGL